MKRKLGKSDIEVNPIGLGCWAIGGHFNFCGKPDGWGNIDDTESIKAIRRAVELGVNFFDTADVYGTGHSERVLGEALKGIRNNVVVATKFGYLFDEIKKDAPGDFDISPSHIRKACEASLKRLNTDFIDLYQLHVWSIPHGQIDALIDTLDSLKQEGLIRSYGWSTGDVEGASIFAEKSSCVSFQHPCNVLMDYKEMIELCEKHDLSSITNAPLAMGILSGKFNSESKLPADDVRGSGQDWLSYFKDGKPSKEFLQKLDSIKEILTSDGRSLTQGALAWIWGRSNKTVSIPGFKNINQAEENAKALEFGPLNQIQLKQIENILK